MKRFALALALMASLAFGQGYGGSHGGYSQHRYGYSISGEWTPLYLSPLQYLIDSTLIDQTANELDSKFVQNPSLTFDGTGEQETFTAIELKFSDVWSITSTINVTTSADDRHLFSHNASSAKGRLLINSDGQVRMQPDGIGLSVFSALCKSKLDEWETLKISSDGTGKTYLSINSGASCCRTFLSTDTFTINNVGGHQLSSGVKDFLGSVADVDITGELRHVFCETSGDKIHDVSGNGNDGTKTGGTWGTQDVFPYFATHGGAKVIVSDGAATINIPDFLGSETVVITGTSTATNSVGYITLSAGYISAVTIDGVLTYQSKNAYGTTLPDSIGTNDATLVNTEFLYDPALLAGGTTAGGRPITNPGGLVHNWGPHKATNTDYGLIDIQVSGGATELLRFTETDVESLPIFKNADKDFSLQYNGSAYVGYNADVPSEVWTFPDSTETFPLIVASGTGSNGSDPITLNYNSLLVTDGEWAKLGAEEFAAYANFSQSTVIKWEDCFVKEMTTWSIAYEWTANAYNLVNNWAGTPCYAASLVPTTNNGEIVTNNGVIVWPS